jgi:hypothetical protein
MARAALSRRLNWQFAKVLDLIEEAALAAPAPAI